MGIKQRGMSSGNTGNNYFASYTTTTAYVERPLGFPAELLSLVNDSDSDTVQVSWDGVTQSYSLPPAEFKDLKPAGRSSVYIKATTGGGTVRITAE